MKIGIYPGSFDPIHLGHIKIINKILEDKLVDKVLVAPTNDYWNKNVKANLDDRINMVRLFENEQIIVETNDNQIKATYDYIKQKEKEYPDVTFSLIVGGDNIEKIDQWIKYDELLKYHFIVIKRDDYNKEFIESKFKSLNKSNYSILNIENIDISSSQIREYIKDGKDTKTLLDKRVSDYIVQNNLYK